MMRGTREYLVRVLQDIRTGFFAVSPRNERHVLEELEAIENATDEQLETLLEVIADATRSEGRE